MVLAFEQVESTVLARGTEIVSHVARLCQRLLLLAGTSGIMAARLTQAEQWTTRVRNLGYQGKMPTSSLGPARPVPPPARRRRAAYTLAYVGPSVRRSGLLTFTRAARKSAYGCCCRLLAALPLPRAGTSGITNMRPRQAGQWTARQRATLLSWAATYAEWSRRAPAGEEGPRRGRGGGVKRRHETGSPAPAPVRGLSSTRGRRADRQTPHATDQLAPSAVHQFFRRQRGVRFYLGSRFSHQ